MSSPFFFDGNVNGQSYLNEIIPLMTMLFQIKSNQDGVPCHGLLAVLARLNLLFGERVLSLHNNTEWPPRSSDLTPCDLFLFFLRGEGYFKDKVFRTPPESLNVLWQRIITECNLLRENRDYLEDLYST